MPCLCTLLFLYYLGWFLSDINPRIVLTSGVRNRLGFFCASGEGQNRAQITGGKVSSVPPRTQQTPVYKHRTPASPSKQSAANSRHALQPASLIPPPRLTVPAPPSSEDLLPGTSASSLSHRVPHKLIPLYNIQCSLRIRQKRTDIRYRYHLVLRNLSAENI